jgi:hypothetical protein
MYINVKDPPYNAVGDGVANDASAIDAAVAAVVAAGGGTVFFPKGNYLYNGVGIDFNPPTGFSGTLWLEGEGTNTSQITFVGTSGSQSIYLRTQGALGSPSSHGGGIRKMGISALGTAFTKPIIVIEGRQFVQLENLYLYGGSISVHMKESRLCTLSTIYIDAANTTGVKTTAEVNHASHIYFDIQANGAAGSQWGFDMVHAGASSIDSPKLIACRSNVFGQGAFRFEHTGAGVVRLWPFLTDCTADGIFGASCYLFKKCGAGRLSNCFGVAHGTGVSAFTFDQVDEFNFVNGTAYSDAAGGSDFSFKNSCNNVFISGVQSTGTIVAYKTDATTHTGIHIDNPTTTCPVISNDISKLQSITQARCSAYMATSVSIPNATWTRVAFDANDWDFGLIHSTTINNTRFTAPAYGQYRIMFFAMFNSNATGIRYVRVTKNGVAIMQPRCQNAVNGDTTGLDMVTELTLAKGDYIECEVYQSSGISLALLGASTGTRAWFDVIKTW